ncbi:Bromodomain-containing protein bet-1 [Caenorhabditis elegans]|uniref:Bromodomain-containing protein bet-1 n=1 Tax=Caenorhabditis elegans TaxID=6239 RepID=A0A5S9MQE5_CAEEL|nr:Bromodomain-containing protein bet-1 [Caenorhabditis elegans]CAA0059112.1 Bromodomain-containing protein bet-1 [Caenorhabditis elegans]
MSEGSGDQSQQRPWASPRQQPIKGIVQPRVLPPFGKPTRHTNKLDYIMTTVLKEAGKHKHVWPFQKPVDAVALCIPLYHERVARPMDLKTIENRLKSTYYTCAQECIDDIETVFQNCYTFNGKEDDVTIMAQNVHEVIKKSLEQAPREEHDMDVYWGKNKKKPAKSDGGSKSSSSKKNDARGPSEAPSEAGSEVSSVTTASAAAPTVSESASVAAKPERKVAGKKTGKRKAESEDDEKPEPLRAKREVAVVKKEVHQPLLPSMKPCLKLLNDFSTKKYQEFAWPFNEPVDAEQLGLHDYHKIIKEPMDLKSMKAKMESGAYKEPSDFEHDVRLMLRNCFLYNPVGDPVHSFGLRFQEVFDRRWAELGDSSSRASSVAPQSAPIAPTPKVAKSSAPKEPKESRKEHKKETTFEASGAKSEDLMQINNALSMIREREEKLKAELAAAQAIKDKLTSVKNRREDNPNEPFPEKLINETRALCTTQVGQNASSSSASSAALRNGRSKKAASARLYGYEFDSDDEDNKMALTYEEKRNLSNLINNLPNNQLNTIISIIQRRERSALMQQQLDDSEVELDFESLGDMCLREMGAFIKTIPTLNGNGDDEKPKTSSNPTSSGATGSKGSSSLESKNGKKTSEKNFNMSESSDDETSNSRKRRKRESSESQSSSSSDDDSDDEDRPISGIPRKSGQPPSTSREWNQSSAPPPRMGGMGGQPPMSRVPASSSTSVSAIGKNNAAASSNSYQAPKPAPVPAPTSSRPPAAPRPPSKPKKTGGASILDTLLPDTFGASPPQSQPTTSATIRSPTESQPGNGEDEQTRIQRMRMEAKRARQKEDEGSVSLSNQMEMMAAFEFDNTY